MTWAEFQLRSFQYWEDVKREQILFREVAYMGYCNLFAFSKKKPKSKEEFWPIEKGSKKGIDPNVIEQLKKVRAEYLKNKENG